MPLDVLAEVCPAVWALFKQNVPLVRGVLVKDLSSDSDAADTFITLLVRDPHANYYRENTELGAWSVDRLSRPSYRFWCRRLLGAIESDENLYLDFTAHVTAFDSYLRSYPSYEEIPL